MIASIRKACQVISCFSNDNPALGVGEIAELLDMPVSTTHHIVSTLCKENVLMKDHQKKYRLGWRLLEWNNHVMFQQDVYDKAMPFVKDLISQYKGTAHIAMFDKGTVVFVLRVSSHDASSIQTYLGSRKPSYATSSGKVLLANNPAYLKETVAQGLAYDGPNTITDISNLKIELADIRTKGYSISDSENSDGMYGIAAPIFSYSGGVIAAVNLVGLSSYMQGTQRTQMIQSVMNTAQLISKELGYIEI
ncbi:IclR family transcriptional regulator [Sporosarcina newyorkensis 2681]|uniref:IclR family transcriptional regulator n=1 Tax=Sporosarcina newyorkensis 2681 TaxID=1027292 RepID=F9DUN0_9BACL|nr:IclR family transcriptional regulator [Sporosarcina newyorkensis]EGQ24155.1 IclR family transcriptional regulator [Sporosarcina newyorkensis 2681]